MTEPSTPYSVVITTAILNWRRVVRSSIATGALYVIARTLLAPTSSPTAHVLGIIGLVATVAVLAGSPYITLTVAIDAVSDATADVTDIPPGQFSFVVHSIHEFARRTVQRSPTRVNLAQVRMTVTPQLLSDLSTARPGAFIIPLVYTDTSLAFSKDSADD